MTNKLIGQASEADIKKWKGENPAGIFAIESEGHIGYFREPTRHDVNKALCSANDDKPLEGLEVLGDLLFIGGSKEILTNDLIFLGVHPLLKRKMLGKEAALVNL